MFLIFEKSKESMKLYFAAGKTFTDEKFKFHENGNQKQVQQNSKSWFHLPSWLGGGNDNKHQGHGI